MPFGSTRERMDFYINRVLPAMGHTFTTIDVETWIANYISRLRTLPDDLRVSCKQINAFLNRVPICVIVIDEELIRHNGSRVTNLTFKKVHSNG